jgi:CsoR family transcriptional regulator, copper-sensing transcriptional repressor
MLNLQPSSYTFMGYLANTRPAYIKWIFREGAPPMERENKPKLLNRLSRIEGQVRGVARMVEDDRYCIDILTQLQAARAALAGVETEMLKDHLSHCIEGAIVSGDKEEQRAKASELIQLLERSAR